MAWLTDRNCFLIAVILYGISTLYSVFLLRTGFRQDNRINYLLLLAACAFHTASMVKRGFSLNRCPIHNIYEATVFIGWTIVAAYVLIGTWSRLRFLGAFASPILFAIGVLAIVAGLDGRADSRTFEGGWITLHAGLILLSYGGFGLSSIAAVMYLMQEHDLKYHKPRAVMSLMPPMQRLELTTTSLLIAGFLFLTAGLVIGTLTAEAQRVQYIQDPKILWSIFVWVVYLCLITLRWRFAQRGRKFAWGAIGSFVFVMLTFWGFSLISPIHRP